MKPSRSAIHRKFYTLPDIRFEDQALTSFSGLVVFQALFAKLDLFVPAVTGFDFKVIITNKRARPKKVLAFHNGRGAQEAVFAELKSQCQMDYVPVRTRVGNQLYLCSAILAHNLARELQMQAESLPHRNTTEKRSPRWVFEEIHTLRRHLLQRAARLIRPQGRLTLVMSANAAVRDKLLHYLRPFDLAA